MIHVGWEPVRCSVICAATAATAPPALFASTWNRPKRTMYELGVRRVQVV